MRKLKIWVTAVAVLSITRLSFGAAPSSPVVVKTWRPAVILAAGCPAGWEAITGEPPDDCDEYRDIADVSVCCRWSSPFTPTLCTTACKATTPPPPPPPPPPPLPPDRVVVCPGEIRYTPGLESTGKTVLEWSHTEDCREAP